MGSRIILFVTALLVFVSTTVAVAQPPQRMQLTPEQRMQRLRDSLALSDSQAVLIVRIYRENDEKRAELRETNTGDREAMRESMRILARETDSQIEAVLTPGQKEQYQVLKKQWQDRRGESRRRME